MFMRKFVTYQLIVSIRPVILWRLDNVSLNLNVASQHWHLFHVEFILRPNLLRASSEPEPVQEGNCYWCAIHKSNESVKRLQELDNLLCQLIGSQGKEIVEIPSDGHCLPKSFCMALNIAGLDYQYIELLERAVQEMKAFPTVYMLLGNYEEELDNFVKNRNYAAPVVDSLLQALVNITGVRCIINQLNNTQELMQISIDPIGEPMQEIELVYYRHREHYDAVNRSK